ncbi:MmcQ/YjbR family DNA-binding protein [Crocinitomix catalasitica]|uniref:MmcQ/YjbR family DNA-binding protein n=1 Tax=Crocinitomix catalasitica TaxID=184607 RepID=UPI000485C190|nr:MmcQ/YjbR family DNA-binding protein [Crocinitomix catalasitica]
MNIEDYREYCLAKKGVSEGFPFDHNTLVFKVMNKMFALTNVQEFNSINLKCDPEKAIDLRDRYHAVVPGYHMSKKHWNTITVNEDATDDEIYEWIDDSYNLIVKSLTKKLQAELKELG